MARANIDFKNGKKIQVMLESSSKWRPESYFPFMSSSLNSISIRQDHEGKTNKQTTIKLNLVYTEILDKQYTVLILKLIGI